jgi:hypothetical protein
VVKRSKGWSQSGYPGQSPGELEETTKAQRAQMIRSGLFPKFNVTMKLSCVTDMEQGLPHRRWSSLTMGPVSLLCLMAIHRYSAGAVAGRRIRRKQSRPES